MKANVTRVHAWEPDLNRAIPHIIPGVIAILAVQLLQLPQEVLTFVLGVGIGVFLGISEVVRFIGRKLAEKMPGTWWAEVGYPTGISWFVERGYLRVTELRSVTTMTPYAIGLGISYMLFPIEVVLNGLIILSFGDPCARMVGKRWPLYRLRNGKSLGGVAAFVVASFAAQLATVGLDLWFPLYRDIDISTLVILQFAAAVGGAFVESMVSARWDNLLIMPYTTAVMAWGLYIWG